MLRLKLSGEGHPRFFSPVQCRIADPGLDPSRLTLVDTSRDAPVPVQARQVGKQLELNWIVDSLAAGQERIYELRETDRTLSSSRVRLEKEGGSLTVRLGGKEFAAFQFASDLTRPFLYPIYDPFDQQMTHVCTGEVSGSTPGSHRHHRSLWTGWGDLNGTDNWRDRPGSCRIVHRCFEAVEEGPVLGRFVSLLDWLDPEGNREMQERREFRFYNVPGSMSLFDVDIRFFGVDKDINFGDTNEGGILALRMGLERSVEEGGRIENAQGGVNEGDCWGVRSQWCDYSGTSGGHRAGLAIFDHPSNFRYPTFWHARDYGLLAANPFGLSSFMEDETVDGGLVVPQGEHIRFRYRAYVHPGDAERGRVRMRFTDWIYPASVEVMTD